LFEMDGELGECHRGRTTVHLRPIHFGDQSGDSSSSGMDIRLSINCATKLRNLRSTREEAPEERIELSCDGSDLGLL
jgi:hypothetical protein